MIRSARLQETKPLPDESSVGLFIFTTDWRLFSKPIDNMRAPLSPPLSGARSPPHALTDRLLLAGVTALFRGFWKLPLHLLSSLLGRPNVSFALVKECEMKKMKKMKKRPRSLRGTNGDILREVVGGVTGISRGRLAP